MSRPAGVGPNFPRWLKDYRTHQVGMSQRELADEFGVHMRTIRSWEDGDTKPDPRNLRNIAEKTRTPLAYLVGLEPDAPSFQSVATDLRDEREHAAATGQQQLDGRTDNAAAPIPAPAVSEPGPLREAAESQPDATKDAQRDEGMPTPPPTSGAQRRSRRLSVRLAILAVAALAVAIIAVIAIRDEPDPVADVHKPVTTIDEPRVLRIYSSLPKYQRREPVGSDGRVPNESTTELENAMRLALDQTESEAGKFAVTYHPLDSSDASGDSTPARWQANAQKAAMDPSTAVYIGDFNSAASQVSIPIFSRAKIPQISPLSTRVGLTTGDPRGDVSEPGIYYPVAIATLCASFRATTFRRKRCWRS